MHFSLLRNGLTSTSIVLDVNKIDPIRKWIIASVRGSSIESSKYHFVAYGNIQDISGTDSLEEITGTITGIIFDIVNKRQVSNSHLEFDIEPRCNK